MNIQALHPWQVDPRRAAAIQRDLADRVILTDEALPGTVRRIAGADVSYSRGDPAMYAAVVVLDAESLDIIEEATAVVRVPFPYIPGLLSFREGPALLAAFEKLQTRPDVILFDGQGIAHPRRLGIASHLGLVLDIPSVGCAKKRLVGTHDEPGPARGAWTYLLFEGEAAGAVLRTKPGVKPLYVSPGHKISIASSLSIVQASTGRYRLPEPTRQAHLAVNSMRTSESTDHRSVRH